MADDMKLDEAIKFARTIFDELERLAPNQNEVHVGTKEVSGDAGADHDPATCATCQEVKMVMHVPLASVRRFMSEGSVIVAIPPKMMAELIESSGRFRIAIEAP